MAYTRISKLKTADDFRQHLTELGLQLDFDQSLATGDQAPLQQSLQWSGRNIGNRFCILPMEGWDGTTAGQPTELTHRRWKNFGISGAKLIWGGEAVAVRHDGRANPNQLLINEANVNALSQLRQTLINAHRERFGHDDDLSIGLQLTHSGRFARPNQKTKLEPRIGHANSILDQKFNVDVGTALLSDDELKQLIDDFVTAAGLAKSAGFEWIDIKHCHGYLGHELLSGFDRSGQFGGSFENRTRFLREIVQGIRAEHDDLKLGVRLSIFDLVPYQAGPDGIGIAVETANYPYAWGSANAGTSIDLSETHQFLDLLKSLGIELLCTTAGSPYYIPHIQRPALFPPSDGYLPPEDPLVGVARQIEATEQLKRAHPELIIIGSGYSYLQEWLPYVAQACVRNQAVDMVGLGRMALSYPDLPADVLAGKTLARKKICRTFSDCTTAPRNGMVSGCYPLDPHYKKMPEHRQLVKLKQAQKS